MTFKYKLQCVPPKRIQILKFAADLIGAVNVKETTDFLNVAVVTIDEFMYQDVRDLLAEEGGRLELILE